MSVSWFISTHDLLNTGKHMIVGRKGLGFSSIYSDSSLE
jgi:hypothetical protein